MHTYRYPVLWIRILFRIRSLVLIFWPEFVLKWCLSLLSFVFWNLYNRGKSFPTEKRTFFLSFKFLICDFSKKKLFYNSASIRIQIRTFFRIWIQPKYSDYFGFESTTLRRYHNISCIMVFDKCVYSYKRDSVTRFSTLGFFSSIEYRYRSLGPRLTP
jgi:hypothetical protein